MVRVPAARGWVLDPGITLHEPHVHAEEELLVVLDGEAELVRAVDGDTRSRRAGAGVVAYYPIGTRHTIRGTSGGPVTYVMF